MTNYFNLLFFFLFLLGSCKSASKAYNEGNYTDAVEIAVKKLQKDPSDAAARSILQRAYQNAVNQHESQIRILSNSTGDHRWEQIYRQYAQLQSLYEIIKQSPAATQIAQPVNYADYVRTYREKTGDAYYAKGLALLENDQEDKMTNRKAYYEFKNALKYKPDDLEIAQKLKAAKEAATLYVLIAPMDNYGGYLYSNSYQLRNFQNELIRNIRYNINNEFVRFVTDWDSRDNRTKWDEVVEMRLGSFNLGRPYEESRTREVSKEVVIKETVYKKDSVVKEYAKVHARITTTRRTLVSNADMFLVITDNRNRIIWRDNARGEHRWTTEFATYTGDERALSESDKALLNRRGRNIPREEEVVDELLRQLQNDVTEHLRDYYRRIN